MTISQDPSAPLVAVVGATGIQGGSVIKALTESEKPYRFRGTTRDVTKSSAKALADKGVEMVQVNVSAENKEGILKFFQGATYAFVMTQFWEHLNKDQEVVEGKLLIDAAKAAGVKRLVWSGLPNTAKASNGKYTLIDHSDGKALITEYGRSVATTSFELVNVEAGFYMNNFTWMIPPVKEKDGSIVIKLPTPPNSLIALIDTESDYGLFVRKAIEEENPPKDIFAYGEVISWEEIAKQLGEVVGKQVAFKEISKEEYVKNTIGAGWPERIAVELWEMFACIDEFGLFETRDIAFSKEGLARPTNTWTEYAKTADWSKFVN